MISMKKILSGTKDTKELLKEKSKQVNEQYSKEVEERKNKLTELQEELRDVISNILIMNENYISIARELDNRVTLTLLEMDLSKFLVEELGQFDEVEYNVFYVDRELLDGFNIKYFTIVDNTVIIGY